MSGIFGAYEQSNAAQRRELEHLTKGIEIGAVAMQGVYVQAGKQLKMYCAPKNFSLTGEQIMSVAKEHVNKQPEAAKQPWGMLVLEALVFAFPCKD